MDLSKPATLSERLKHAFLSLFGMECNYENQLRYKRINAFDKGDLWHAMRQGQVSVDDILWYAKMHMDVEGCCKNAALHLESLAIHYLDQKDTDFARFLFEKSAEQYIKAEEYWPAALIYAKIGMADKVRSLYPAINESEPYPQERLPKTCFPKDDIIKFRKEDREDPIGLLELRLRAFASGGKPSFSGKAL